MEADNNKKFVIVQQIYDMKKPSDSLDDKMLSLISDKLLITLNFGIIQKVQYWKIEMSDLNFVKLQNTMGHWKV